MASSTCTTISHPRNSPSSFLAHETTSIRGKAFSHLDNLTRQVPSDSCQDTLSNISGNDKIVDIKRKYEKLLKNSFQRPNETSQNRPIHIEGSYLRSSADNSHFLNKPSLPVRSGDKQYGVNYQRAEVSARNSSHTIEHNLGKKGELKSQLQLSRSALSVMKSELQAKLSELSSKTTISSSIGKGSGKKAEPTATTHSGTQPDQQIRKDHSPRQVIAINKLSIQENRTYDDIIHKYSKPSRYGREMDKVKPSMRQEKVGEKSQDLRYQKYMKKYMSRALNKQQLSIISEKSNSHQEESFKDNQQDLESRVKSKAVDTSQVRQIVDPHKDQLFKKHHEKITSQNSHNDKQLVRSSASSLEPTSIQTNSKVNSKYQYSFEKLELNVPIKRTTAENHFSIDQKIKGKEEEKQSMVNNYLNQRESKGLKKQASKVGYLETDIKEATFGKGDGNSQHRVQDLNKKMIPDVRKLHQFKQKYGISKEEPKGEQSCSKKPVWKQYQFKGNEDISQKIDRIDQRIKEIESNKKNLNINFRPYQAKSTPKYGHLQVKQDNHKQALERKSNSILVDTPDRIDPSSKVQIRPRFLSYLQRVKPMYSQKTIPQGSRKQSQAFSIRLIPVENGEESVMPYDKSTVNSNHIRQDMMKRKQLQWRTDSGIEERKRKLQDRVETTNNTKELVKALGHQAVVDQEFRNNKIWFSNQPTDTKWRQLSQRLQAEGFQLSENELKEEFSLMESQNNPFFSVSESKCDVQSLVKSYLHSRRVWGEKVFRRFSRSSLQGQGLSADVLDLDRKGYILIEDLVRFLNIESGAFLRNRDVWIMFRRINSKSQRVTFQEIMSTICQ